MINLPVELGSISKNLPLGPWAFGQVYTDKPMFCWQVYSSQVQCEQYGAVCTGSVQSGVMCAVRSMQCVQSGTVCAVWFSVQCGVMCVV